MEGQEKQTKEKISPKYRIGVDPLQKEDDATFIGVENEELIYEVSVPKVRVTFTYKGSDGTDMGVYSTPGGSRDSRLTRLARKIPGLRRLL